MSLKLSLIFVFGLLAVSINANVTPAATILQQALAEAYPDFPLALKASGEIYKAMAIDALKGEEENAIVPIWKTIIKTLTDPKGAETFKLVVNKIKKIIEDDNAQQTLINIFATLYTCFTYDVGESGIQFPWKELRKMINGNGKSVFPLMYGRFWQLAQDANTGPKLALILNSGENTFENVEQKVLYGQTGKLASGYRMPASENVPLKDYYGQTDRLGSGYQMVAAAARDVDGFADGNLMRFEDTQNYQNQ
ncbi:uncharacterized protein LOC135835574 [Planococcus citri]|uniref:uncharacterized protein LOC135835574 n=1 Tax=Planococcus citri TaxID=170843 RepID=UPI0031F72612